jgi:hypothetical protein
MGNYFSPLSTSSVPVESAASLVKDATSSVPVESTVSRFKDQNMNCMLDALSLEYYSVNKSHYYNINSELFYFDKLE